MTRRSDEHILQTLEAVREKYISPSDFWSHYQRGEGGLHVMTVNLEIFKDLLDDPETLARADRCTIDSGLLENVMNALFPETFERLTGREIVARSPEFLAQRGVVLFGASEASRKGALAKYRALGAAPDDVAIFEEPTEFSMPQQGEHRLWAGFFAYGHPKQETRIAEFKQAVPHLPLMTLGIGGATDYFSGVVKTPPAAFHRLGLEWVWRLGLEPRKRARRVLSIVPLGLRLRRLMKREVA